MRALGESTGAEKKATVRLRVSPIFQLLIGNIMFARTMKQKKGSAMIVQLSPSITWSPVRSGCSNAELGRCSPSVHKREIVDKELFKPDQPPTVRRWDDDDDDDGMKKYAVSSLLLSWCQSVSSNRESRASLIRGRRTHTRCDEGGFFFSIGYFLLHTRLSKHFSNCFFKKKIYA